MSSVRGTRPLTSVNDCRFDVDPLDGLMLRSRIEAEQAAIGLRDVARLAGLDRLAELPTLDTLIARFGLAAALADRHDGRLALLLVDTDSAAEDRRVVEVARRLAGSVRAADTVCRLAGDQFVVLLTDVARDSDAASASRNLQLGLEGEAGADPVACSIGISFYPDHGHDVETLIGRADAAMNGAKALGPGHCRSYDDAAVVENNARRSVVSPVDQPHVRRARSTATVGPSDELREINEELLRVSIRVRDERDRAQQHLRIALAAADMGRWAVDLTSGETVRSVRHDQLYGYPGLLQHWTPDVALERFVPEDRAAVATAWHEARTTGFVDFEHRIRRADDLRIRWLHVSGEAVHEGGVALRIVGVVTDVTDRRAAEAALRLEATSRLTGGARDDVIERPLEPMFATKPAGSETGLGSSRVDGFAKESGGLADIRRGAEGGTVVAIRLPRLVPDERAGSAPRAVGTVLVVEDDPGVRATINAMLRDLGYEVIEADAVDAARAMVAADTPIDLVLGDVVDVVFGDVVDHVVELGRRRGGVPIVLTSARAGRCVVPDELVGRLHVLHKPYTQGALASVLHDALGARPTGGRSG